MYKHQSYIVCHSYLILINKISQDHYQNKSWTDRNCLSWRDITCSLPLQGLSFVLPVCRRWIISLEMVIPDTLKWSATAWWVIQAWTIPTARSWSFWRSRGIDVLAKIKIFRKLFTFVDSTINERRCFKCLIQSLRTRSWDGKLTFRNFSVTEHDVIVYFVRINVFHTNIGVNDNKQLFWF